MNWTPYHNLTAVVYAACAARGASTPSIATTEAAALKLAKHAFPSNQVRALFTPVTQDMANLAKGARLTSTLKAFTGGRGRESRRALDRLILAWSARGFAPEVVVEEAYADYASIPNMPELTRGEVATYAFAFWDFASLWDPAPGVLWLNMVGRGDDANVFDGTTDFELLRISLGCSRALEFGERMKRLAMKTMYAFEQMVDALIDQGGELNALGRQVEAPSGAIYTSNDHIKNVASFMASVVPLLKLERETSTGSSADVSLDDLIRITHDMITKEEEDLGFDAQANSLQRDDLSPEKMREINGQ